MFDCLSYASRVRTLWTLISESGTFVFLQNERLSLLEQRANSYLWSYRQCLLSFFSLSSLACPY